MTRRARLTAAQVFVAGGLPTITYNPRAELGLETQVLDYLDERNRVLSVFGPTKTGKTVLVKNVLKETQAIWTSGGAIRTVSDLWSTVADELALIASFESSRQDTDSSTRGVSGELQVPTIAKVAASGQGSISTSTTDKTVRNRPTDIAARKALRDAQIPIVIDDFHYINTGVQMDIVRSLKDLVFDGVPVIVIAVPHRAYDVMRVEKEMTGRVEQLSIGFWSNADLRGIAEKGFTALQVTDEDGVIAERLAAESFASPHLMQDFCLQTVKDSGYREVQEPPALLQQPMWEAFFKGRSASASKTAFDKLVRGPRQRTDRKSRTLKNGLRVDIYGAVLMAIGHTGPLTSLSYEQLRAAMREIAAEDAPSGQEITRILGEMTKIARDIEGEPVVDYDASLATLHISDPYFAFFLRWRAADELSARGELTKTDFLTTPASASTSPAASTPDQTGLDAPTKSRERQPRKVKKQRRGRKR